MGQGESQPLPPWFESAGKEYPPHIRDAIVNLSGNASAFLSSNPQYYQQFELEHHMPRLQGALTFDKNIASWYPKLVPRKVSEQEFWQNYFSHVASIVTEGQGQGTGKNLSDYQAGIAQADSIGGKSGVDQPAASASSQVHASPLLSPASSRTPTNGLPGSSSAHSTSSSSPHSGSTPITLAPLYTLDSSTRIPANAPVLRWALVGCGESAKKFILPALLNTPGARVVGMTGSDQSQCQEIASGFDAKVHPTLQDLLQDQDVDAVYIATPPGSHAAIAIEVARAKKACVVERVLGRTADESRAIHDEFVRNSTPLYSSQHRRFLPRILAARQLIQQLGQVVSVSYTLSAPSPLRGWRSQASESGGGPFMEIGTEVFDLLEFILGSPLTNVHGDAALRTTDGTSTAVASSASASPSPASPTPAPQPLENLVSATFRAGIESLTILGAASFNFTSSSSPQGPQGAGGPHVDVLVLIGTRGTLSLSLFGDDTPSLALTGQPHGHGKISLPPSPQQPFLPFLTQVTQEMRAWRAGVALGPTSLGAISAGQAVRTSQAVDSVLRNFYRNRLDAFWTRPHTWKHGREGEKK